MPPTPATTPAETAVSATSPIPAVSQSSLPSEISSDENLPGYLEGASFSFPCTQGKTTERGDGTITLSYNIAAQDLPPTLVASPEGSLWRLHCPDPENENRRKDLIVSKKAIRDGRLGQHTVTLLFVLMPARAPSNMLWGNSGQKFTLEITALAGKHPYPTLTENKDRASVSIQLGYRLEEPLFQQWIASTAQKAGFDPIPSPTPDNPLYSSLTETIPAQQIALENVKRLARFHSRTQILSDAPIAQRVNELIYQYRRYATAKARQNKK